MITSQSRDLIKNPNRLSSHQIYSAKIAIYPQLPTKGPLRVQTMLNWKTKVHKLLLVRISKNDSSSSEDTVVGNDLYVYSYRENQDCVKENLYQGFMQYYP